jgi:hypothetical protein
MQSALFFFSSKARFLALKTDMESNCDALPLVDARGTPARKRKRRMCAHPGCKYVARAGGDRCGTHGGAKHAMCAHPGCKYSARAGGDRCVTHGAAKTPNRECAHISGCKFQARPGGFCVTHGGPKPTRRKCAYPGGCTRDASGAHAMCVPHGCPKQTRTLLRCTYFGGCKRYARPGFRACARHGGGKRCAHEGCPNGAVDASGNCGFHGGGKRCAEEGCPSGAAGATDFCKIHGGGLRCPNCATWPDSRGGNRKYDGHCATCFKRIFPNDPRSKVIYEHTKEIRVRNALNEHFDGFVHDTPIWTGGCDCTHRRRVDHRKLINGTLLCVETDEHAHSGYDKRDEEIRYDDLFMVHSGKWIFIRFNPDGRGVDMEDKLACLMEEVEFQTGRIEREENTELLEIIKLFY